MTSMKKNDEDDAIEEGSSEDTNPLIFFYDCETTGFSIYTENITEIAAKVVGVPLSSLSQPTFSSLVRTTRNISKKGKVTTKWILGNILVCITLTRFSDRSNWHIKSSVA